MRSFVLVTAFNPGVTVIKKSKMTHIFEISADESKRSSHSLSKSF